MSEEKGKNMRGEISPSPGMVVEWKVPCFLSWPKDLDYGFRSPSFSYLDGTWFLKCYPNGRRDTKRGWMDLYVRKDNSSSIHTVTYQIGIRTEGGSPHVSKTLTKEFDNEQNEWGIIELTEMDSLKQSKRIVAPENEINFFCLLTHRPPTSETVRSGGAKKVIQDLKALLVRGDASDLILKVKERRFSVHSAILVARSPVFAAMMRHDMKEKKTRLIEIEDCEPEAFQQFLNYIYAGELQNSSIDMLFALFNIADKYDVKELRTSCSLLMMDNISIKTFCDVLILSIRDNESEILEKITEYFEINMKQILESEKWLSFVKENPVQAVELHRRSLNYRFSTTAKYFHRLVKRFHF